MHFFLDHFIFINRSEIPILRIIFIKYLVALNMFAFNSPGIMLLIFRRASSYVPLKILSIEDGTILKSFNHLLHRNKKVDFIEQFNEKLLVKQENENLQILDVSTLVHL